MPDSEEKPVDLSSEEADAIAEVIVLHQAIRFLEERGFIVMKEDMRPMACCTKKERDRVWKFSDPAA